MDRTIINSQLIRNLTPVKNLKKICNLKFRFLNYVAELYWIN